MCNCEQKEKLSNPRTGYFDYVFLCKKSDGKRRVIAVTSSNDTQAKHLAELQCRNDEDENSKVQE